MVYKDSSSNICVRDFASGSVWRYGAAKTASSLSTLDFSLSRDGSTVVFAAWDETTSTVNVVKVGETTAKILVTIRGKMAYRPSFSPDGKRIVFTVDNTNGTGSAGPGTGDADSDLWVVNSDGTDSHILSAVPHSDAPSDPVWSPDGNRIAYTSTVRPSSWTNGNSQLDIKIVDLRDGTRVDIGRGAAPAWSPDGRQLAVTSSDANGAPPGQPSTHQGIYLIDIATKAARIVSTDSNTSEIPTWSPDGKWIAFDSGNAGNSAQWNVDRIHPDGSSRETILKDARSPYWVP